MDGVNSRASYQKNETLLLVSLFIFELSLLVMWVAMYLKGERSFAEFLSHPSGLALGGALGAFVITGAVIVRSYVVSRRSSPRNFRMIVAMNLIAVMLMLVIGEIAVRAAVLSDRGYDLVGTLVLKPNNWEKVKTHYLQYVDREERGTSIHMYDLDLGWTLRPNTRNSEGPSWSSLEGLRASGENVSFAKHAAPLDIALVGDSYTFGQEVQYEEAYGYYLERMLGSQSRVLNFGVPGYGIGQMLVRYEKDVRPWKPKIVILGFISHDVKRTLWVYPFLSSKKWESPFPKARFILREGELVKITESLPTPRHIFTRTSISDIPLIELQKEYWQPDWEERFYHVSYLVRLFESWASRLHDTSDTVAEEDVALNAELLRAFIRSVKQEGAIPLVVFFPVGNELQNPSSTKSIGRQVLKVAGIDYVDPTSCLLEVDPEKRFRPLLHYSAEGNAAVAKCVYEAVKDSLAPPASRPLRGVNDGPLHYHH